jgi:hypothetical protein
VSRLDQITGHARAHIPETNKTYFHFGVAPIQSKWIMARFVLHCNPMGGGELLDDPLPSKPTEPAVLLPTEGAGRSVIHARAVDVSHASLNGERKA